MPGGDIYRCKSCNEESLVLPKSFLLLPFPEQWIRGPSPGATAEERDRRRQEMQEWERLHLQTLVCDTCELMLSLPKEIDAVTWNQWKREDLLTHRPHSDYPFLVRLVGMVDEALAASPKCVMEFGQLSCPYCSRMLVPKDQLSPTCKRCGSSDLEHVESGMAAMSASFPHPWPPIV